MDKIIAVMLLALADSASAASHNIDVRVSNGMSVFAQTMKLSDGQQANFVGPVAGGKRLSVNALLSAGNGNPPQYNLEYQLELSGGQTSSFQVQSALSVRPGLGLITAECGSWTVELSLDAAGTLGRKKKAVSATWDDGGLGNYRLTADLARGAAHERCRVAVAPGSQTSVADGFMRGGKRRGLIFNALPAAGQDGVHLQYQIEYAPMGMKPLQIQNQESLTLGRESHIPGQGYKLSLLAEAAATRAAPQPSAPVPAAAQTPPADTDSKTVPLLR